MDAKRRKMLADDAAQTVCVKAEILSDDSLAKVVNLAPESREEGGVKREPQNGDAAANAGGDFVARAVKIESESPDKPSSVHHVTTVDSNSESFRKSEFTRTPVTGDARLESSTAVKEESRDDDVGLNYGDRRNPDQDNNTADGCFLAEHGMESSVKREPVPLTETEPSEMHTQAHGSSTKNLDEVNQPSRGSSLPKSAASSPVDDAFICDLCDDTFEKFDAWQAHLKTHCPPYKCSVCDKDFGDDRAKLKRHRKQVHLKKIMCGECVKTFSSHKGLKDHIICAHVDERPYSCDFCAANFSLLATLKRHEKAVHLTDRRALPHPHVLRDAERRKTLAHYATKSIGVKAEIFSKDFSATDSRTVNGINTEPQNTDAAEYFEVSRQPGAVQIKKEPTDISYSVSAGTGVDSSSYVQESEPTTTGYHGHLASVKVTEKKSDEIGQNPCNHEIQGKGHGSSLAEHGVKSNVKIEPVSFTDADLSNLGMERPVSSGGTKSNGEKRFPADKVPRKSRSSAHPADAFMCDLCEATFEKFEAYQAHRKTHSPPYTCTVCEKNFGDSWSKLKSHRKQFHLMSTMCEQCGKTFASNNGLKIHIKNTHTDEKPYACDFCDAKFSRIDVLHDHEKAIHLGPRCPNPSLRGLHGCSECPREFATLVALKQHAKVAHRNPYPFFCSKCPAKFKEKKRQATHEEIHFNGCKLLACEHCGWNFVQPATMAIHVKKFHAP